MGERGVERVVLELNPGEPISGTIRGGSGDPESFRGWLELASRLERLRTDRATEAAADGRAFSAPKPEPPTINRFTRGSRANITGRDALTPSERRVAVMAAEGRTTPEIAQALFVTTKTIDGHLNRTYMKLGINSRKQLTEALAGDQPEAISR
jgi:DNA-binding CsgD family transcriptional regulator